MSGADIAGLIAAGVFAILVALLALPIIKLGKVFDELHHNHSVPQQRDHPADWRSHQNCGQY